MFLVGRGRARPFLRALSREVARGGVPLQRVNDAVGRVLRLKAELGLFRDPCGYRDSYFGELGSAPHRQLARRWGAEKGCVSLCSLLGPF